MELEIKDRSLLTTPFNFIYGIPYFESDQDIGHNVSNFFFFMATLLTMYNTFLHISGDWKGQDGDETRKPVIVLMPQTGLKNIWKYAFSSAVLVPLVLLLFTPSQGMGSIVNASAFVIYVVHYFHRVQVFSWHIPSEKVVPLLLLPVVYIGEGLHSFVHAHYLLNILEPTGLSVRAVLGIWMCWVGEWISLNYLIQLEHLKKGEFPTDGLSELASCPEIFGEFLLFWGMAVLTGASFQIAMALFCSSFLIPQAINRHRSYKEQFGDKYPTNRKILVPFLV